MPLSTSLRPMPPEPPREALAHEAPPVRVHPELRRRVRDDRRRPLDRVDLRDQRRVHEPGAVEEIVVRPGRVVLAQRVADRVVLEREQRVQDARGRPRSSRRRPRGRRARRGRRGGGPARRCAACRPSPVRIACAKPGVAAVDLRGVPPVAVRRHVGRRRRRIVVRGRVAARARDLHRPLSCQVSSVGDGELPGALDLVLAVAEPVVHLELEPRAGEQVERRRGDEALAGEQLAADECARSARGSPARSSGNVRSSGTLRPKRAPDRAHPGFVQVVVGAVHRAGAQVARRHAARRWRRRMTVSVS